MKPQWGFRAAPRPSPQARIKSRRPASPTFLSFFSPSPPAAFAPSILKSLAVQRSFRSVAQAASCDRCFPVRSLGQDDKGGDRSLKLLCMTVASPFAPSVRMTRGKSVAQAASCDRFFPVRSLVQDDKGGNRSLKLLRVIVASPFAPSVRMTREDRSLMLLCVIVSSPFAPSVRMTKRGNPFPTSQRPARLPFAHFLPFETILLPLTPNPLSKGNSIWYVSFVVH